jgi:IS5 family transposase
MRLMAGITVLKYMHELSDEAACDRWVGDPYFQFFCGEEFFQHRLVFDRSSLTHWRWRQRLWRRCPAIPTTATRSVPSFRPWNK